MLPHSRKLQQGFNMQLEILNLLWPKEDMILLEQGRTRVSWDASSDSRPPSLLFRKDLHCADYITVSMETAAKGLACMCSSLCTTDENLYLHGRCLRLLWDLSRAGGLAGSCAWYVRWQASGLCRRRNSSRPI